MKETHRTAVFEALFVTFLWSTSWVLIKIGLADIPSLVFAGLRYTLAALLTGVIALSAGKLTQLKTLPVRRWLWLAALGLVMYTIAQGAMFDALNHAPAVTVSLLLNITSIVVALLGSWMLRELPTGMQWMGIIFSLAGVGVYFYPLGIPTNQFRGLLSALICMLATSMGSVLGREANQRGDLDALTVTASSMGLGAPLLLVGGIVVQGFPGLSLQSWLIILWMAIVNTAFAFTLWNHSLRSLPAFESSVINNTMLVQIAILAWLFLGETLSIKQISGMMLVTVGTAMVSLKSLRKNAV